MVVTFGRDVKVIQYFSNDYRKISACVGNAFSSVFFGLLILIELSENPHSTLTFFLVFEDNLECEGTSPLEEGICLCNSSFQSGIFHPNLYI